MRDFDTAIDLIIRFLNALPRFIRDGVTPQTLMLAAPLLFYIFKFQAFKRTMGRYFPGLVKGETVNPVYVGNQMEIKHNLSRLLKERGMEWETYSSPPLISKQAKTQNLKSSTFLLHKVIQWGNQLERMINMKKFRSRKFILAVVTAVLIVLNDGLDLGIDSETVLAFAGIVAVWITGETVVDARRVGGKNAEHYSDTDHSV